MDYIERRVALAPHVKDEGLDAFVIINAGNSDRANQYYLTGFTGSLGIVWIGREAWMATDSRYTEQATGQVGELPVRKIEGQWSVWLAEQLQAMQVRRVGLAAAHVTVKVLQDLQASCQDVEIVPTESWVDEARRVKEAEEIERVANAAQLTDRGLRWILGRIRPGMPEREVALELETWYRRQRADAVAFDLIVASGPHSSRPHHRPGDRSLTDGEVLLFDIGVQLEGYCSDLTRVVAIGQVPPRVHEVYEQVLAANQAGLEAV
ncbi:MAG: Xaa-Pro peptidase family protein, partial [Candidatus Bipolaricaulota bacterium]